MPKPNPQAAIQMLDRAVASINTNRQTHSALVEALSVLDGVVKERDALAEELKEIPPRPPE